MEAKFTGYLAPGRLDSKLCLYQSCYTGVKHGTNYLCNCLGAFDMRGIQKILQIPYTLHITTSGCQPLTHHNRQKTAALWTHCLQLTRWRSSSFRALRQQSKSLFLTGNSTWLHATEMDLCHTEYWHLVSMKEGNQSEELAICGGNGNAQERKVCSKKKKITDSNSLSIFKYLKHSRSWYAYMPKTFIQCCFPNVSVNVKLGKNPTYNLQKTK